MARLFSLTALAWVCVASAGHDMPKVEMPREFDQLKALLGTWEGTTKMESGAEEKVTVVYEMTSGGTAIVEKLMPGTPHEMISVYHKEGPKLAMTHYCSIGNQPHMPLIRASASALVFEMTRPIGVTSMKEPHMHALTLTMVGSDSLQEDWTHYENGKKKASVIFNLNRKKG